MVSFSCTHTAELLTRADRSRTGRKGPFAAYYVQISPKSSFVGECWLSWSVALRVLKLIWGLGAGLWMPEAQPLALLRRNIDRKPEKIRQVLTDAAMLKLVLGGVPNDEKKAIDAFVSQNQDNALKTKPKVCQYLLV